MVLGWTGDSGLVSVQIGRTSCLGFDAVCFYSYSGHRAGSAPAAPGRLHI